MMLTMVQVCRELVRRMEAMEEKVVLGLRPRIEEVVQVEVRADREEVQGVKERLLKVEQEVASKCSMYEQVEEVERTVGRLEEEVRRRVGELGVRVRGVQEEVQEAVREYIEGEVLGQVEVAVREVAEVRAVVGGEVEEVRCRVEGVAATCSALKSRLAVLENPRRTFDETELYACRSNSSQIHISIPHSPFLFPLPPLLSLFSSICLQRGRVYFEPLQGEE